MEDTRIGAIGRLGRLCYDKPWWTVATWIVGLVVLLGVSGAMGSDYAEDFEIPASGSRSGFEVLEQHFEGLGTGWTASIVYQAEQGVDDPAVVAAMQQMFDAVADIDGVTLYSPYEGFRGGIDSTGTIGFAELELDGTLTFNDMMTIGTEVIELRPELDGLQVEIGGSALAAFEPPQSELIGIAFAIFVLILSFGSVLAMGLPISVALAGVLGGVGLVTLLSNLTTVPEFALTISIMLGLGVGIDYALFIVTRYRERVRADDSRRDALALAMDTSGRAVLFAGTTVVISLMGMLLMGLAFVSGLAIAAATAVVMTMIAALTLLPAIVALVADRIEVTRWRGLVAAALLAFALVGIGLEINVLLIGAPLAAIVLIAGFFFAPLKRKIVHRPAKPLQETAAYRLSRFVQHRPWSVAISAAALLLLTAFPILHLELGFSDEGNFQEDTTTRRAYDLLAEGFGPGFNGPLFVTGEVTPADFPTVQGIVAALRSTDGVATVSDPFPNSMTDPTAVLIQVFPTTSPQAEETYELVGQLRDEVLPSVTQGTELDMYITGTVAVAIDFTSYLSERTLWFFAAVLSLSFLLLLMVFRSILIPVKAVVMNLLSISASYGVVVALFQWGWLDDITGLQTGPIEPFVPMMMFAVVFGLSMDYEVFLLSRIREEYERSGDASGSVADGLAATARVISAAAAIMVVVFGAFLFEDDRVIKLFGIGLGFAVLIDATVVRMLLVPATMELLGTRNWWIPAWLDRILPRIGFEGPAPSKAPGRADRRTVTHR